MFQYAPPSAPAGPPRTQRSAAIPIVAPPKTPPSSSPSISSNADTVATNPTSSSSSGASTNASKKPCRNVAIYGHCKYENEGCTFDHSSAAIGSAADAKPSAGTSSPARAPSRAAAGARDPSVNAIISGVASGQADRGLSAPSSPLRGGLSAKNAAAAVFVPKGASTGTGSRTGAESGRSDGGDADEAGPSSGFVQSAQNALGQMNIGQSAAGSPASGRATPNSFGAGYEGDGINNLFDPTYTGPLGGGADAAGTPTIPASQQQQGPPSQQPPRAFNPYEHMPDYGDPGGGVGVGGAMEYYTQPPPRQKLRQPLQYHLYAPPLPHVSNLHPHHLSAHAFFMSPTMREDMQRKQEALHAAAVPAELGGPHLPEELHVYHSFVPLEPQPSAPGQPSLGLPPGLAMSHLGPPGAGLGALGEPSKVFGYRSHLYKAICTLDGKTYVLRRLEGFRLTQEAAIGLVERWRRIRHPSIVSVREAFTTRAFGDHSIVFVYDYHPLSSTMLSEHMTPKPPQPDRRTGRLQPVQMQIPERVLWSYICQLASALRTIHANNMAARCVEPSKVLRTGKNRVRLNCCSIFDVIAYEPRAPATVVQNHQAEDLVNLGKLLVSLCCNNAGAVQNLPKSLEQISRAYSNELKNVVLWLLGKPGPAKTAEELGRLLGSRVADELDSSLNYNDLLENSLMRELENGRLVRLLCKFGFINERPEYDHDPRWSETGDRYIIKLFRDHVFHAVDEGGRPVVDLSHILTNLNKLDAGVDEKIMLTSRDEQSCLVVSYREIKNCIESAFQDLSRSR